MNIVEIMIIALASALEIASIVLCKGAVFSKISKEKIGKMILIFSTCQLVTLIIGNLIAFVVLSKNWNIPQHWIFDAIVIIIFIILGIEMFVKAFQNDLMQEIRNDIMEWSDTWKIAYLTGITSLMTGFGFGLLDTSIYIQILVYAVATVVSVIIGLFVGFRFGYHPKRKAYFFAGTLLLIIDLELFYRIFVI